MFYVNEAQSVLEYISAHSEDKLPCDADSGGDGDHDEQLVITRLITQIYLSRS